MPLALALACLRSATCGLRRGGACGHRLIQSSAFPSWMDELRPPINLDRPTCAFRRRIRLHFFTCPKGAHRRAGSARADLQANGRLRPFWSIGVLLGKYGSCRQDRRAELMLFSCTYRDTDATKGGGRTDRDNPPDPAYVRASAPWAFGTLASVVEQTSSAPAALKISSVRFTWSDVSV
jgi:hypothetical protein